MHITVDQVNARVPVAILRLQGDLDGSNYRDVIERAQALYQAGQRDRNLPDGFCIGVHCETPNAKTEHNETQRTDYMTKYRKNIHKLIHLNSLCGLL